MARLWNWFWTTCSRPLLALIIVGVGLFALAGYHGFMEYTNRTEFCISCHEMSDTVYKEYKESVHFHNSAGVRAECADCHVPEAFVPKVLRKINAAKDVWHTYLGTIDTPEKFEEHRLRMAQTVWSYMQESGSRECKSCHGYDAMHAEKQGRRAKTVMGEAAKTDVGCIECHKGIAHRLPKFDRVFAQWTGELWQKIASANVSSGKVYAAKTLQVRADGDEEADVLTTISPMKALDVVETGKDWIKVRTSDNVEGWIEATSPLSSHLAPLEDYAQQLWQTDCQTCHVRYDPERFDQKQWVEKMQAMAKFTYLDADQQKFVLHYLQNRARQ